MYIATITAKGKIYFQIHGTVFIWMNSPQKAEEAGEKMLLST